MPNIADYAVGGDNSIPINLFILRRALGPCVKGEVFDVGFFSSWLAVEVQGYGPFLGLPVSGYSVLHHFYLSLQPVELQMLKSRLK